MRSDAAELNATNSPAAGTAVVCTDLLDDKGLSAVVLVLCEWAYGKMFLNIANKIGCPLLCDVARVEYRRALRVKRQLDVENQHTDHLTPEDVGLSSNDQAEL